MFTNMQHIIRSAFKAEVHSICNLNLSNVYSSADSSGTEVTSLHFAAVAQVEADTTEL